MSVDADTTRVETVNAPVTLIAAEPVPMAVSDDPVTPDAKVDPVKPPAGTAAAVMLVLQPNPVFVVQIRALPAVLHPLIV